MSVLLIFDLCKENVVMIQMTYLCNRIFISFGIQDECLCFENNKGVTIWDGNFFFCENDDIVQ